MMLFQDLIIYTTSYTSEERDLLIHLFNKDTPKEFYDFLKKYKEYFRKDLSFLYITKILNIFKLINEKMDKYQIKRQEIILKISVLQVIYL